MKLIGLTGAAGSGKDYSFDRLFSFFTDWEVVRYALADEVRIEAAETVLGAVGLADIAEERGIYLGEWSKPYSASQRVLLQFWGTEYRRAQDPDYWVNRLERTLEVAGHDLAVVTDVRFENEAAMIRRLGGIVVEVQAPADVRASRLGGKLPPAHASEVLDFETDGTIQSHERTVLSVSVAEYLGLPAHCTKCRTLYDHAWHDGGTWNDRHEGEYPRPGWHAPR